ncbi:hypothetical protein CDD80_248 [Ophiocordyceps camponoti-rufipedis]|uniref:SMP domain-containing protein n=1 Tax=Ophiocordyceps camponoti-rufipedis TaxID=2004952 RepID=A0A2C5ZE92_9HYPO|nr:hypothetical protein CDD80_248 [Ophiocordyceps camponoti-rufipedis]
MQLSNIMAMSLFYLGVCSLPLDGKRRRRKSVTPLLTMAVNRPSISLATNPFGSVSVESKETVRRAPPMDSQAREILEDGDGKEETFGYFQAKDDISINKRDVQERQGHMLTGKTSADPAHEYIRRDAKDFKGSEVAFDRPKTEKIGVPA